MHDPSTLAFEIKSPFREAHGFRPAIVSIWHDDPCRDGTDDSCGWFPRSRHGDKDVLEKIRGSFNYEWDAKHSGLFDAEGRPLFSVSGIVINLFRFAAWEFFGHDRAKTDRFMRRHLCEILFFAENGVDSLHSSIVGKYGPVPRSERVDGMASCIYAWILRAERRWWQHPRWHVHHWRVVVHPLRDVWRWIFERCAKCGGRFRWREGGCSNWDGNEVWHSRCDGAACVMKDPAA